MKYDKNFKNLNVVFGGCARDCEKYLPKVMRNIDTFSSCFNTSYKIIVENGSKDGTKDLLKKFVKDNDYLLIREDLSEYPYRGKRLENARNLIIDTIKENKPLRDCDLFVALDFDDRNIEKIEIENFEKAINFLIADKKIAGVFANQIGTYYDMWGLIDDKYCKSDFWAETLREIAKKINPNEKISSDLMAYLQSDLDKKKLNFGQNLEPIKVKSAYGGLGIYKIDKVIENKRKYKGDQIVEIVFKDGTKKKVFYQKNEIVNFNLGFDDIGLELYILPYLINNRNSDFYFPVKAALSLIVKENIKFNI